MSGSGDVVKRGALVGVILVSSALGANAMTVARCNVLLDGAYRTALLVESNGEMTVHHVGTDGLTRGTVFNEQAALAWAAARYGAPYSWNASSNCFPESETDISFEDDDDDGDTGGYLVE